MNIYAAFIGSKYSIYWNKRILQCNGDYIQIFSIFSELAFSEQFSYPAAIT